MCVGVASLLEALEILEDVVVPARGRAVVGDEHRDLVRPGDSLQLLALVRSGRHLAGHEVDPELGETLAHPV
jgi:hypothetical protein